MKRDPKPYTKYPPALPARGILIVLGVVLLVSVIVASCSPAAKAEGPSGPQGPVGEAAATFQGKTAHWWAMRAQQARRDANARRLTIRRLRRTLRYSPTIQEAVRLAAITFPAFSEQRAWAIIDHESQGNPNAKNRSSTASGLYQFLTSTWASTPYGRESIWNPYAASLAAGWMHAQGRRCEWWC